MGIAKQNYLDQPGRGYCDIGDKYVCPDCFEDKAIKDFIKLEATEYLCDYCKNENSEIITAAIDKVLEFIMEGIFFEWEDPNNPGVRWNSGETRWQGKVIGSWDLIYERDVIPTQNEEILEDIYNSLNDRQWCKSHFNELRPEDVLRYGWSEFAEKVKHHTRYVFLRVADQEEDFRDRETIPPSAMLDSLAKTISKVDIIRTITRGTEIFRVRIHKKHETFSSTKDLGPLQPQNTILSNRMSPAGIPMFYGALDKKTALKETYEKEDNPVKVATIATFKTLKEMRILDLTSLPDIPSLFDKSMWHLRPSLLFLHSFVKDVSKPISKDGKEHIEYVPTQVFTEYFRHIYRNPNGEHLDGIFYQSAKHDEGTSCVLFIGSEDCCDSVAVDETSREKMLLLERVQEINPRSVISECESSQIRH